MLMTDERKRAALMTVLALAMATAAAAAETRERTTAPLPAGAPTATDRAPGPHESFMPVVVPDPAAAKAKDKADKPAVMTRQRTLLEQRYDLRNDPSTVKMAGGRKAVQQGVRVRLPAGKTWQQLAGMAAGDIKQQKAFPQGFLPLPHVKHATGGMVFPRQQIDQIRQREGRSLERFDVDFDLPDHLTPEFPPPIFLTTRPELGDVSRGQLLTIKNYYDIMHGIMTPVQIEGLRLLLTPFPQQQFNQTEDRKVEEPQLGVSCLDCHANGHTNATFHLNPDTRPQSARFRIDTVSLRGMFNQQIHGSKRSLRSIEDFTEFEQRTAYFDGDHVTAAKKGVNLPDRASQVAMMAQTQNILDFPPAPKLLPNASGRLDPAQATEQEKLGEQVFFGKGQCATCHAPPHFLDDRMHDLKIERFHDEQSINDQWIHADGPIKTFTLRGIKDSPPYLHDGRLLTLEDSVEFFNLILSLGLDDREKDGLVHYMRAL
jgi:cytochrome c peroxidase